MSTASGSMDILTILIVPFHENRISFHLLVCLSMSSSMSSSFQCAGLSPPWLTLFPGILFFLNAVVNRVAFFLFLMVHY